MAERPSHTPPPGQRGPFDHDREQDGGVGRSGRTGPGPGSQPSQPARPAARPLDRPAQPGLNPTGKPAHPAHPSQPAHALGQGGGAFSGGPSGGGPGLTELVALLEHEPALGLAIVDEQGRTITANRRFEALTVPAGGAPGATASDRPAATQGEQAPAGESAPGQGAPASGAGGQAHKRATSTARRGVWARVGAEAVRTAAAERHPVVVHFIHEGRQVQCDIWPLPAGERGPERPRFLAIAVEGHFEAPGSQEASGAHPHAHAQTHAQPGPEAKAGSPGQRFTTLAPLLAELGALSALTARELEVLALIGQGMATREIAEALGRSPRTVERHCDAIHKKLHTSNRVQMARYAMRAGLTPEAGKLKRV